MMALSACPAPSSGPGLLPGLLNYIDCQTQALGVGGYQALSSPGSTFSVMLTGMLVLFVALLGYRLLFGNAFGVRDGVLTMIKIGVVLTFAASWPAYRTLIYDVALRAPAEVAADIGAPAQLPGAGGGLVARLDGLDQAFIALAIAEQTLPTPVVAAPPGTPPTGSFNSSALGSARIVYLTAAATALGSTRLIAGLLLALGPIFIAFLLFDGTRGLFEGWARGLIGAALGALGVSIALGLELALMEPRLADLIARRTAGQAITGAGVELFVIALVFALLLVAMLAATARVALGLRLPHWQTRAFDGAPTAFAAEQRFMREVRAPGIAGDEARSRAVRVADAVAATQRRETTINGAAGMAAAGGAPSRRVGALSASSGAAPIPVTPLGQSFQRRSVSRISAASGRRDAA